MKGDCHFIEQRIMSAVRELLIGRVNELLMVLPFSIPAIELGNYTGGSVVVPAVSLSGSERSEKDRLLLLDVYVVKITFSVPASDDGFLFCYAYSSAVFTAVAENPTLDGVVTKVTTKSKKYAEDGSGVTITLRLTVEDTHQC